MDAAPMAVWDTRTADWSDPRMMDRVRWATANFPDAGCIFRAEFYLIDVPFAVVHCYAVNANGRRYLDLGTDGPVTLPPARRVLASLPPQYLW